MEKLSSLKKFYNKFFYCLFIENFNKSINFNFKKKIYRWHLIQKIIDKKKIKKYLEIGCDKNQLFSKIKVPYKVGVDPNMGGNIKMTSDNFFKQNHEKFDLIFIDGLHHYEQVKKDLINSLKVLNYGGLILVHDCLPQTQSHQAVPRYRMTWTGDVWKAIVELRCKKNLNIFTILIDMGISVVQKKRNQKKLYVDIKNFKKLKFRDFYYNNSKYMNIVSYEKALKLLKM